MTDTLNDLTKRVADAIDQRFHDMGFEADPRNDPLWHKGVSIEIAKSAIAEVKRGEIPLRLWTGETKEGLRAEIEALIDSNPQNSAKQLSDSIMQQVDGYIQRLQETVLAREAQPAGDVPVYAEAKALFMHLWACRAINGSMWIDQPDVAKLHAAFSALTREAVAFERDRGLPMSAIQVGMKLRHTVDTILPVITVTGHTEKGFTYKHERFFWRPGEWSEGGESYGQGGYSYYKPEITVES